MSWEPAGREGELDRVSWTAVPAGLQPTAPSRSEGRPTFRRAVEVAAEGSPPTSLEPAGMEGLAAPAVRSPAAAEAVPATFRSTRPWERAAQEGPATNQAAQGTTPD